jgi:REP element-mobilizing transposase RayT
MQLMFTQNKDLKHLKARTFGGVKLKSRRKTARPLQPGSIHHVVFKSSKAQGKLSFYFHKQVISHILRKQSRKFFIEILDFVNMGNHFHLKARFKDRRRFGQFLKSFSAMVARAVTGARKGHAFGRFWDGLVYTRVLLSKFEEFGLRVYFEGNHRQRDLGYAERDRYLKRFNQFLYRLKQTRAAPA